MSLQINKLLANNIVLLNIYDKLITGKCQVDRCQEAKLIPQCLTESGTYGHIGLVM